MAKRKKSEETTEPETTSSQAVSGNGADEPAPSRKTSATPTEGYTVLARRYRPQQFADLVGQEPVAQALVNALESNRVAHAYLFTGARGVGKTSCARILAKALNCVKGPTAKPCDECDSCRAIASGEDVDVLELDGASNRGIDDVREIRQNAQYRPSRAQNKVYIIDEVHMLTKEAFNALLKTLEEPPPHVKFIFATTDVHKVPITILSRCQRFDFAGIGTTRIVDRLREVVASEGMQADNEALELVARRAGGSMRDAQSLLDQLLAFGGQRLSTEQVHQLLGTATDERVLGLAAAVLEHDAKAALETLAEAAGAGLQLGELLDQLMEYWRDLMVVRCAGEQARDLSVSTRHRETMTKQAAGQSLDTILAGLDILSATKARLRGSSHARILLEMALVRISHLEDLVPLAQLARMLSGQETGETRPALVAAVTAPPVRPSVATRTPTPAPATAPIRPAPSPVASVAEKPAAQSNTVPLSSENLVQLWGEILKRIGVFLAAPLEKCTPAISGPFSLAIRFTPEYNVQREHCQDPKHVARLEEILRQVTGQSWSVRVESTGSAGAARQPAPEEASTGNSQINSQRQREEAAKEPLIKRAIDVLGAQIVRLDDGFGVARPQIGDPMDAPETEDT